MTQPTVCALLLTADRQALTDRCVRSFLAQDYERKALLIYDTGEVPYKLNEQGCCIGGDWWYQQMKSVTLVRHDLRGMQEPIGRLRNYALQLISAAKLRAVQLEMAGSFEPDIICHFDSDDWSAPSRISDQVKLLVESGKDAVGYREMLVWDSRPVTDINDDHVYTDPHAWLYTNTNPKYVMETSMCYWRSAWEKTPFDECMQGEAKTFMRTRDVLGVSAWNQISETGRFADGAAHNLYMIAELHGANTSLKINAEANCHNPDGTPYWRRVPEGDERVRQILEGA